MSNFIGQFFEPVTRLFGVSQAPHSTISPSSTNASSRPIQEASMPKNYGNRRPQISDSFDEVDEIVDDGPAIQHHQTSLSRPAKRSAEQTSSVHAQYPKRIKRTDVDEEDERRLLGDFRSGPNAVAIPIPTGNGTRYSNNNRAILNGESLGGLHVSRLRGTFQNPKHTYATLGPRENPRRQPPTFSSRLLASPIDDAEVVEVRPRKKRRRSNEKAMSREEPVVIDDDDETRSISPPAPPKALRGSFEQVTPSRSALKSRSIHSPTSIDESTNAENVVRPGKAKRTLSTTRHASLDLDEEDEDDEGFTKRASMQRRKEANKLTRAEKQQQDAASYGNDHDETLRNKFRSTDGRRRDSMGSPDVLSGTSTVRRFSPTRKRETSRFGSTEELHIERKGSVQAQRAKLGRRAQGPVIVDLTFTDLILPEKHDYILSLEDDCLAIRSPSARLGEDPIYTFAFASLDRVQHGGAKMIFYLKMPPGALRMAHLTLNSNREVWSVANHIAEKATHVKLKERAPAWISRAEEKTERHKIYDTAKVERASTSRPSREEVTSDLPQRRVVKACTTPKLKDQLEATHNDIQASAMPSNGSQPLDSSMDNTRAVTDDTVDNTVSEDLKIGQPKSMSSELEHPRRSRRTVAKHSDGEHAKDDLSTDSTVPFSQTGQLGPAWTRPLIYPKTGKKRAEVEFRDLERLDENEFLNDNLIGFFLRFLEHDLQENRPDLAKKMYFFNSYFFATLTNTARTKRGINYEGVQKWTRGVNLFEHDFVVVPINENAHWYVAVICNLPQLLPGVGNCQSEQEEPSQEDPRAVTNKDTSANDSGSPAATAGQQIRQSEGAEEQEAKLKSSSRQPLAELAIDQTDRSFKDLNIDDGENVHTVSVGSDVNEVGSLLKSWGGTTAEAIALSSPGKSKKGAKSKKAARRSGVGLQKYEISTPVIITMDSLGMGRSPTTRALREYVVEEAKAKLDLDIDGSALKGMTAKGIPGQDNYSDCGLYLLAYMERFVLDPYLFVASILRREMDETSHWPVMESSNLRNRLREFLLDFYKAQDAGEIAPATVNVGRILLGEFRRQGPAPVLSAHEENETVSKYFNAPDLKNPQDTEPIESGTGEGDAAISPPSVRRQSPSTIMVDSDISDRSGSALVKVVSRSTSIDPDIAEDFEEMFVDDGEIHARPKAFRSIEREKSPDLLATVEQSLADEVPETQQEDDLSEGSFTELEAESAISKSKRTTTL